MRIEPEQMGQVWERLGRMRRESGDSSLSFRRLRIVDGVFDGSAAILMPNLNKKPRESSKVPDFGVAGVRGKGCGFSALEILSNKNRQT